MTVREDSKTGDEIAQRKSAAEAADPMPEIDRGTVIGRYTVLERIGADGTATLFSAFDAQLARIVALEVWRSQLDEAEIRTRMLREAQAMTRFKHAHVVRIYTVGTLGDRFYIAMELVAGATLRSWMSQPRPWREALAALKAAGRGLAAAHEAGLVHRDFNPDNVLIAKDGRVLVTGFGLARREQRASVPSVARKVDAAKLTSSTEAPSGETKDEPKKDSALPEAVADKAAAPRENKASGESDGDEDATVALKQDALPEAGAPAQSKEETAKPASDDDDATVAFKADAKKVVASDDDGSDDATVAFKADAKKLATEVEAPVAAGSEEESAIQGRPGYSAPEHLFTGEDNARGDQFSFAVTMYVTLYGKPPFRFRNLATYRDAVKRPPEPPPTSPVPAWIHGVIERGLQRDPQHRFSSMSELLDALERDPARSRRLWGLGAAAAAAGIAVSVGYGQHRADVGRQCAEGAAIIAGTWNPAVERSTHDALAKAGGQRGAETAKFVTSHLSAYAQTWAATHRKVAEATLLREEQDTATMERRLRCLERGRDQLAALTEILSRADDAIGQHAIDATFALPPPESCASEVAAIASLPASPNLRARVRSAERAIAEAIAHSKAGEQHKAEEIILRVLPDVRAIPHPRTEAELLMIESDCKQDRGDPRAALESADGAFQAAQHAADDSQAARAAARIAYLFSSWLDNPQEGERWMKTAEVIADRAGHSDALDASLLASRIPVNAQLGYPERNLELHDKEVALLEHLYTARDPRVARAVANRGITYYLLGKFERALVDMQQGILLMTRAGGSFNPSLVHDYTNLGATLVALGRTTEARDAYEHARALQADAPSGALTVTILGALAGIELEVGTPDSAIEIAEHGLGVARATGEKGMREWVLRLAIANAKGKKGDFAGEAQDCRAVLAQQKAADAFKRDAPYTPDALTCLGLAELGLHHVDAALAHLEESVTFQLRTGPGDLPQARFALAKALRIAGRDATRAREMAVSARNDLLKLPNLGKELAAVDSWLEETNGTAPPRSE